MEVLKERTTQLVITALVVARRLDIKVDRAESCRGERISLEALYGRGLLLTNNLQVSTLEDFAILRGVLTEEPLPQYRNESAFVAKRNSE